MSLWQPTRKRSIAIYDGSIQIHPSWWQPGIVCCDVSAFKTFHMFSIYMWHAFDRLGHLINPVTIQLCFRPSPSCLDDLKSWTEIVFQKNSIFLRLGIYLNNQKIKSIQVEHFNFAHLFVAKWWSSSWARCPRWRAAASSPICPWIWLVEDSTGHPFDLDIEISNVLQFCHRSFLIYIYVAPKDFILSSSQNHSMTSRLNQVLRIPTAPLASPTASPASPAARKILGMLIADSLAAARAKSIQDIHQHGDQKWSQGNIFQKMMPSSSRGHNPSNVTSLFRGGYTECEPTQKSRQIDVAWPPKNMTEFLRTEFCWTNS